MRLKNGCLLRRRHRGVIAEDRGRELLVRGWIADAEGNKLTQAEATMARVSEEKMRELLGKDDIQGDRPQP